MASSVTQLFRPLRKDKKGNILTLLNITNLMFNVRQRHILKLLISFHLVYNNNNNAVYLSFAYTVLQ